MDYLNNISFSICQNCKSFPYCYKNQNNTVTFSCKCNKHTIPLSSYYSILNHHSFTKCSQHSKENLNFYCLNCISNLCNKCIDSHQSHFILSLSNKNTSLLSRLKLIHKFKRDYRDCGGMGCLLLLNDGHLCVSDYELIKIFNLDTFKIVLTLNKYTSIVSCILQLKNGIIVASYLEDGLVFFDFDKKTDIFSIEARGENIRDGLSNTCLCHIDQNRFAACLLNKITILSSNPPYDTFFVLEGHAATIASMLLIQRKNILISCSQHRFTASYSSAMLSEDKKEETLRIWGLEKQNCIKIFNDVDCYSNKMCEYDNRIVVVGGEERIILIDYVNFTIEAVIEDIQLQGAYVYSLLKIDDDTVLLGCGERIENNYGRLGVLDLKNKTIKEKQRWDCEIYDMVYIKEDTIAIGGFNVVIVNK